MDKTLKFGEGSFLRFSYLEPECPKQWTRMHEIQQTRSWRESHECLFCQVGACIPALPSVFLIFLRVQESWLEHATVEVLPHGVAFSLFPGHPIARGLRANRVVRENTKAPDSS